jgi:hypothetical protein
MEEVMEEQGIKTRLLDWGCLRNYPLFRSYVLHNYGSLVSVCDTMLVFNGAKFMWSKAAYTPALLRIMED